MLRRFKKKQSEIRTIPNSMWRQLWQVAVYVVNSVNYKRCLKRTKIPNLIQPRASIDDLQKCTLSLYNCQYLLAHVDFNRQPPSRSSEQVFTLAGVSDKDSQLMSEILIQSESLSPKKLRPDPSSNLHRKTLGIKEQSKIKNVSNGRRIKKDRQNIKQQKNSSF